MVVHGLRRYSLRVIPGLLLLYAGLGTGSAFAQSLRGSVVDSYTGEALGGVTVLAVGTLFATATAPDGTFNLGPMPAGSYEVQARLHGYVTYHGQVVLAPGEERALDVVLSPEFDPRAPEAIVGQPWTDGSGPGPVHQALRRTPAVQRGRRGLLAWVPVVRGLHGAQVEVVAEGARSAPGSPLGPTIPTGRMPAEVAVITGPYALATTGGSLSAVRIATPFVDGGFVATEYAGEPRQLGASGAWGRVGRSHDVALNARYDNRHGYEDPPGTWLLRDERSGSLRGRMRRRWSASSLTGWGGFAEHAFGQRGSVSQQDAGAQFSRRLGARGRDRLELQASGSRRTVRGWPYSSSTGGTEVRGDGTGQWQRALSGGWTLTTGADLMYVRLAGRSITTAGAFAFGSGRMGGLWVSGALRGTGVQANGSALKPHLSASFDLSRPIGAGLQVSVSAGTAVRHASLWERSPTHAPYVRMPFATRALGNPAIRPERVYQVDLSLRSLSPKGMTSVHVFARRVTDQIDVGTDLQYANKNAAAMGGEAFVSRSFLRGMVHTTALIAYLHGPTLAVAPGRFHGSMVFTAPAGLLVFRVDLEAETPAEAEWLGTRVRIPGYRRIDLELRVPLPQRLRLTAELRNASNAQHGRSASGLVSAATLLQEPGRQWVLRLTRTL